SACLTRRRSVVRLHPRLPTIQLAVSSWRPQKNTEKHSAAAPQPNPWRISASGRTRGPADLVEQTHSCQENTFSRVCSTEKHRNTKARFLYLCCSEFFCGSWQFHGLRHGSAPASDATVERRSAYCRLRTANFR